MGDTDNGSLLWTTQGQRFGTIVIDPPWPSAKGKVQGRHHWMKENMKPRYSTMKAIDILALPLDKIALPDAVLALWVTWMHLQLAMKCIEMWGFRYATGMPWLKVCKPAPPDIVNRDVRTFIEAPPPIVPIVPIYGPGPWFQHCTELMLIARRGQPFGSNGNPRPARKGIIIAPRQEHSRKPGELQDWIDDPSKGFPGPKLEMFATQRREGWTSWGTHIEGN